MRISLSLLVLIASAGQAQTRPPALYVQIAGEGLGISGNFDVGVTQSLRLRSGVGRLWTWVTVPITTSYLISRGNSTFEVGGGATLLISPPDPFDKEGTIQNFFEKYFFQLGQGTQVVPLGTLGWRFHQPHGIILRLGLTPLLVHGNPHLYGGAGLGLTF